MAKSVKKKANVYETGVPNQVRLRPTDLDYDAELLNTSSEI